LEQAAVNAEHLAVLRRCDLRTAMLIPLRTRGRTVGVLSVAGGPTRAPYTAADVALAEELAARVAATVENARSYQRERVTAETLTRALMPGRLPDIPGLDLAARYRPAGDVGGDFYDCFPVGGGSWMVVLGDVCGRGVAAAAMTGLTRHSVRAAALHHAANLPALLGDVNKLLGEAAAERTAAGRDDDRADAGFCTLCLARFTPTVAGARVDVVSAGHPLPFIVRADGTVAEIGTPGSLLGILPDIDSVEESVEVGPGDAVVLFTDGITERRQQRRFFEDQLPVTLRGAVALPAAALAERVEQAALSFAATAPDDDMAVVVVSVPVSPSAAQPAPGAGTRPGGAAEYGVRCLT
jgi:serine phosphatase RsbU (regulator of sigma subunit)